MSNQKLFNTKPLAHQTIRLTRVAMTNTEESTEIGYNRSQQSKKPCILWRMPLMLFSLGKKCPNQKMNNRPHNSNGLRPPGFKGYRMAATKRGPENIGRAAILALKDAVKALGDTTATLHD